MSKKCIAEYIGTFVLVFSGTSAIVVNDLSDGRVTHVGIAMVFGLVVAAMIYTLGDISGAHLNPAVTIGFWCAKRFPRKNVIPYILSQILGAVSASLLVYLLFLNHETFGATLPSGTQGQSFILELVLTFILMLTIINVSSEAKEKGIIAGLAIGSVVGLEALFAGPISGASMNPARSIGPALLSGHFNSLWLYIVAPILGACLAIVCCRCVREKECCR